MLALLSSRICASSGCYPFPRANSVPSAAPGGRPVGDRRCETGGAQERRSALWAERRKLIGFRRPPDPQRPRVAAFDARQASGRIGGCGRPASLPRWRTFGTWKTSTFSFTRILDPTAMLLVAVLAPAEHTTDLLVDKGIECHPHMIKDR